MVYKKTSTEDKRAFPEDRKVRDIFMRLKRWGSLMKGILKEYSNI
jgi:hypothetical protein